MLSNIRAGQQHQEQKKEQTMTPTSASQAVPEALLGPSPDFQSAAILKGEQLRNSIQPAQRRDHRFFLIMAILVVTTVFVGFFPTYFQKPLERVIPLAPSPTLATIIHIHAVVMIAFFLFYLLQTALISVNRKALHM